MIVAPLLSALAFCSGLLPSALACNPPMTAPCHSSANLTIGTDGPPPPETAGFLINHVALLVNDLAATRHFYGDVLGMRHIFSYKASERYTIMYMGHQPAAARASGPAGNLTGCEMFQAKNRLSGLVEFAHLEGAKPFPATKDVVNTFSHLGLVVPDTTATQTYLERAGVKIVKRVGEMLRSPSDVATIFGLADEPDEAQKALAGITQIGFDQFLIVEDPDGNVIEIQPQM